MRYAVLFAVLGAVLTLVACAAEVETGRSQYDGLCAGCHGPGGKGDGQVARQLGIEPADLTGIAARNGGVFPRVPVMAKIHGYAKGKTHSGPMPAFWPLLEGRKVLVDTGDGVMTPTPEPLVQLTAYIEGLQN